MYVHTDVVQLSDADLHRSGILSNFMASGFILEGHLLKKKRDDKKSLLVSILPLI